jgi:glutamate--cysteine ligase
VPTTRIDRAFERRLAALINARAERALSGGRRGVEKESLRVTPEGYIAQTAHPRGLGSALTSENITTDYSEALIELVTPTFADNQSLFAYLSDLHHFVYQHLGDELLWATSMPCRIESDESIPIAQYGPSNVGQMKRIYREGLGLRYGRVMQAIAGVHFNYSFPDAFWEPWAAVRESRETGSDFISRSYFDLLRNYRRYGWLTLYLFGVSPMVCKSFLRARGEALPDFIAGTAWRPHATSLRMSDLGYRNRSQAELAVSLNSVEEYVRDLTRAIMTPNADYEKLGVLVDGEYRQLNANLLQIENEYYAFIRPKRVALSGERPTKALLRAGVQYVEVRSLDISAFDPLGVADDELRFVEAFLAFCVMRESPLMSADDQALLDGNHVAVASAGRDPGLMLNDQGRTLPMTVWAKEILDQMQGVCELLDSTDVSRPYSRALELQRAKIDDVSLTPSARLVHEVESSAESFFHHALAMSQQHKQTLAQVYQPDRDRLAAFAESAEQSLQQADAVAAAPQKPFAEFLADYFA